MAKRLFSDFAAEAADAAIDYVADQVVSKGRSAIRNAVAGGNQSKNTQQQQETALEKAVAVGEQVQRVRCSPRSYRLHSAKWLQMDKMLKSLFFPMNSMCLNFGISSFTGANNYNYTDALGYGIGSGNEGEVNPARTRGLHRGLALFTVRNTFDAADRVSATYLNNSHAEVGGTRVVDAGGTGTVETCKIQSIYRRYHNQPELIPGQTADAGTVGQVKCQTLDDDPAPDTSKMRNLDLGFNLAQMEEVAASSMVYSDPIFNYRPNKNNLSATSLGGEYVRGNTGVLTGDTDDAHPTIKDGVNNMLTSTETIGGQPCYLR